MLLTSAAHILAQSATKDLLVNMVLPAAGVVLVLLSLVMMFRKRRQRDTQRVTPREQLQRLRERQAVKDDLERIMVEVEELSRRFGAQLDQKTIQLERLIAEADERIAELRRLSGEDDSSYGGNDAGDYIAATSNFETPATNATAADNVDDDSGAVPAATDAQSDADPHTTLAERVGELADQGLDAVAIARQLDEHVGKVELILALRRA